MLIWYDGRGNWGSEMVKQLAQSRIVSKWFRFPCFHPRERRLRVTGVYWIPAKPSISCRWSCTPLSEPCCLGRSFGAVDAPGCLHFGMTWNTLKIWLPRHHSLRDSKAGGLCGSGWWRDIVGIRLYLRIAVLRGLLAHLGGPWEACHQLSLMSLLAVLLEKQNLFVMSFHEIRCRPFSWDQTWCAQS